MLWRGFQKPKRLAVDAETLTEKFGKFSAQPFERGFGTTIGNALRRTLAELDRRRRSHRRSHRRSAA
jgi:DNA-directed RNA polymerase subunit alpha